MLFPMCEWEGNECELTNVNQFYAISFNGIQCDRCILQIMMLIGRPSIPRF